MPINVWDHRLDLRDVFRNDDLSFPEKRDRIAARIKRAMFYADDDFRLTEIVERIEDAADVDEFDEVWDEFYDYADIERIWVETR